MFRKTRSVIRSLVAVIVIFFLIAVTPAAVSSQGTENTYTYISKPLGIKVNLPYDWQVNEYRNVGYGFSFISPDEVFDENGELMSGAYITVSEFNTAEGLDLTLAVAALNSVQINAGGATAKKYSSTYGRETLSIVDIVRDSYTYRFILHYNSADTKETVYATAFESILSSLTFIPQEGQLPEKQVDLSDVTPLALENISPGIVKQGGFSANVTAAYQPLAFPFESGVDWKITSGGGYRNNAMHGTGGYAEYALDFQRSDGQTGGKIALSSTNGILSHIETTDPQCIDVSIAQVSSTHDLYLHLCHIDFESYLVRGSSLSKGQVIGAVATNGCGGYCVLPHIHIGVFTGKKGNPWTDPNSMIGVPLDSDHNLAIDGESFPSDPTVFNQHANKGPYRSSLSSFCSGTPGPTDVCDKADTSTMTDISNPDSYSCSQPGYVDFEDFANYTNLSSGTIAGMQFTTTNGYSWRVGDFSTDLYNGKYPNGEFTSQGTHWAWLGETQGAGRIDFPKGPASYFSLLVSNETLVSVDAYSSSGELLETVGPSQFNTSTGHMTELKITRITKDIAYVMVHDSGNYFLVDYVCTDAPGTPTTINRVADETYFMETGDRVNGNFFIDFISGFWKYLRIFIGPFFSDVDLVLTRPDGTIVAPGDAGVTIDKTENFIEVSIERAAPGQWSYEIIANELEPGGENIQIVVDEQVIIAESENHGSDTAGVFRPSNGLLYLKQRNSSGFADLALNYGRPGDYPVVGDWDGDGTATIGIYRNGYFYLRYTNTFGFADLVFPFGQPGDQPIAGDWNGDGVDTIGVYRPFTGQFLLRNSNNAGAAEMSFYLGNVGDVGIAGDWNGDGFDTTGVFRPSNGIIFLKNTNQSGFADVALNYGIPGDKPVTGDWDNNGTDTIGIYRNGLFYLRNSNNVGFADIVFGLGNPGDMPIAGNWDGIP